ncbi:MAG: porin [Aestuariivita sp.]|uniref:porin n=1 Tax=Aestuariivita sp. TaxID=1872407 RepID=UPI003BAF7834
MLVECGPAYDCSRLFATTALIATASVAAADVRISGYGRFGLDWNEANGLVGGPGTAASAMGETSITSRLRLQFDMSTETDGGVTFGARFRAQAESRDNVAGGAVFNGARFFASFGGFTVGVGNIIGALEGMSGLYLETRTADIGIDGAGFQSVVANMAGNSFDWDAYSSAGTGVNGLEVIYSAGNFGVHVSYSDATTRGIAVGTPPGPDVAGRGPQETNTAISAFYTFGDWTVALGHNDESGLPANTDNDITVFTVAGDLGFMGVRLAYATMDNTAAVGGDSNKLGLYGTFDIGAATSAVVFVTSEDSPGLATDGTGYGFNVSHDLGGGVSIEAGYIEASNDNSTFQAGVWFSF